MKWFLVVVAVVGIVLFLYGANYYDAVVGWAGVSLVAASVVGLLALYVLGELEKRKKGQKS
jgi:hypothetical protein